MPDPNAPYTALHRPCAQCGQEPYLPGDTLGSRCRTTAKQAERRRHRDRRMAEMAAFDMTYTPAPTPAAPPPAEGRPAGPCPRCQVSLWTDRGNGQWVCGSCNFVPGESGVRTLPAHCYAEEPPEPPTPYRPAPGEPPSRACTICGPAGWVERELGVWACRLCGQVA
jgi:hypothetical protein